MSSKTDSLRPRLAEHNQNRPAVRPPARQKFWEEVLPIRSNRVHSGYYGHSRPFGR